MQTLVGGLEVWLLVGTAFDPRRGRCWTSPMTDRTGSARAVVIRTAVPADLPVLQQVFRAASLSNEDDAQLLLAHLIGPQIYGLHWCHKVLQQSSVERRFETL